MSWTGLDEETPVENKLITKSITGAQVKVEGYHFDIRKHLLEYDDVLNKQREIIYADRHEVLDQGNLKGKFIQMLQQEFALVVRQFLPDRHTDNWNVLGFLDELGQICPPPPELGSEDQVYEWDLDQVSAILSEYAETVYEAREAEIGEESMRTVERLLLLRAIDTHWVQHLTAMENLRTGIGLHAYGQRDPLVMYRSEGHQMFQDLTARIRRDVVHTVFHVALNQQPANTGRRNRGATATQASPMQAVNNPRRAAAPVGDGNKVGRNAPCPCGSNKKYKRCHGAAA